jgi:hypothetical protein
MYFGKSGRSPICAAYSGAAISRKASTPRATSPGSF